MLTLRELFDTAAKGAKENFYKHGEVYPVWIVEFKDGQIVPIGVPMVEKKDREALGAMLRKFFKENGVTKYVNVVEAWMLKAKKEDGIPESIQRGGTISVHPDREEVILIHAGSKNGENIYGEYHILRPEHGKATLSPLKVLGKMDQAGGIFDNMLED